MDVDLNKRGPQCLASVNVTAPRELRYLTQKARVNEGEMRAALAAGCPMADSSREPRGR